MSEPYMKWQDELCGLCKHSHQSHGATDGGRCRVRGCLCSKFNEVIERDQAIHELEAVIETLRAQKSGLLAALETQGDFWYSLPSGVDEEAEIDNESPEDAAAHVAGLAVKAARAFVKGETNA